MRSIDVFTVQSGPIVDREVNWGSHVKDTPAQSSPKPIAVISSTQDDYDQPESLDWMAPEDDSRVRTLLFKFLPILFLCMIAYWPTWRPGGMFVWQDDVQITHNGSLKSADGLGMLWAHVHVTPQWTPLGYTMVWPQQMIWSDKTPVGYHIVSLLVHSLNALMVWMLLRRLEVRGAFVAGLVFALHPLQVESVAWIARQPMLWGAFWGLGYLIIYLRWSGADPTVPNPSRIFRLPEGPKKLYALAILAYLASLLCAPVLVCTLPLVMGLIVWWKQDSIDRKTVLGLLPFLLLSIGVVTLKLIIERPSLGLVAWPLSFVNSIVMAARAIGFFIMKFAWPVGLTPAQKNWIVTPGEVIGLSSLLAILLVLIVLWARRTVVGKAPFMAVSILLLLLLPFITPINRSGDQSSFVAERFAYLACAVMAASAIELILQAGRPIVRDLRWPWPVAAATLVAVLAITVLNGHANSFANATALWQNTISQDSENIVALVQLAKTKASEKDGQDEASRIFQQVLRLTGRQNMDALIGMGRLVEKNDPSEALRYYEKAVKAAPGRPEPIEEFGPALIKQRRPDDAIKLYNQAIVQFPNNASIYCLLGKAKMVKGDADGAIESLKKSIELNAYEASSHIEIASCYFTKVKTQQGNPAVAKEYMDQVRSHIEKAGALDPRNYDLFLRIGEMSLMINDLESATLYYRIASYIKPEAPEPSNNVGFVLTRQALMYWQRGQPQLAKDKIKEGIVYFKRAISLNPDFESAKKNLATAENIQKNVLTRPPPTQPASQPVMPTSQPAAK